MRKLNVAIVGCGWVSDWHVRDGIAQLPDLFSIVACCDPDAQKRDAFGERYAVLRRVSDLPAVLAMGDVDVVVLCTPPSTHYSMVLSALEAGKHVVCEKPLTSSLALADEMIEAERRACGRVMSVFQYRFGSELAKIHHLVKSGLLGKAYVSSVETAKTRGADYYKVPWRGKFATELGGVLLTQSIHTHDLFIWLMGPCKTVSAFKTTRVNPIEVEDCAVASLVMQDGSLASLTATLGSVRQLIRMRLCFENATLELQAFEADASQPGNVPWTVLPRTPEIGQALAAKMAEVPPTSAGFVRQYELLHEALFTGGAMPVSLEDGRRSLALITAIFQSAETGKAVSLPLAADAPKYGGWVPEKPAARPAKPQRVG